MLFLIGIEVKRMERQYFGFAKPVINARLFKRIYTSRPSLVFHFFHNKFYGYLGLITFIWHSLQSKTRG